MVPAFKKLRLGSGAFLDLTIPAFKETLPAKATLFEVGFDERVRCSKTKKPINPRETNPKGHWEPNCFFQQILIFASSMYPVLVYPVFTSLDSSWRGSCAIVQRCNYCSHPTNTSTLFVAILMKGVQTHTMTIYAGAKINRKMAPNWP
jgi:hypothetical protein